MPAGALFSIISSVDSMGILLAGIIWPLVFPLTLQYNLKPVRTYIFMAVLGSVLLTLNIVGQ